MDDVAEKTSKNRVLNFAKFCNGFLDENELQFEFCGPTFYFVLIGHI